MNINTSIVKNCGGDINVGIVSPMDILDHGPVISNCGSNDFSFTAEIRHEDEIVGPYDIYLSAGTYSNGYLYFSGHGINFSVDITALLGGSNPYVTGGTMSGDTLVLTRNDGFEIGVDLSQFNDSYDYLYLNGKIDAHTGDTSIHFTLDDITLSNIGSSAHTHSISEINGLQGSLNGDFVHITGDTMTGNLSLPTLSASTRIVTSKISPYINSISGVTITKSDGITPVFTVDTINNRTKLGHSLNTTPLQTLDIAGNFNFDQVADATQAQQDGITLTQSSTGGTLAAGKYYYNVVFYTADGDCGQSFYSTTSVITTGTTSKITLTNIPISTDPRVIGRKIYRGFNNQYFCNYVASLTLTNNTSTTTIDTGYTQDASLSYYRKANETSGKLKLNNVDMLVSSTYHTSLGYQTFFGYGKPQSSTAFGATAGRNSRGGSWFGYGAGYTSDGGNGFGYAALNNSGVGTENSAFGDNAIRSIYQGYSKNVGFGDYTLGGLFTNSSSNVAVGYSAGYGAYTGISSYNTILGARAYSINSVLQNGSYNILLGYGMEVPAATTSNFMNIGQVIYATGVGTGGSTPSATGKVGVGTTAPFDLLDIRKDTLNGLGGRVLVTNGASATGTSNYADLAFKVNGNFGATYYSGRIANELIDNGSNSKLNFYLYNGSDATAAGVSKMVIMNNNNVGIGITTPVSLFDVAQPTAGVGTVTITTNTTCTGTRTQFTNTFKVGDSIILTTNGETRVISAIASDTVMTIASATNVVASKYTLAGGTRFSVKGNGNVGIGTITPVSTLDNAGSQGQLVTTITSATTLTSAHNIVLVNSTGATTVTLPAASTCTNRVYTIKNINSGACTIDANGSELIEGALTQIINYPTSSQIVSSGTAWWII